MWFTRHLPLYMLLLGLIVHGAVLTAVYQRTGRLDTYAFNSRDSGEYYQIARNLVGHGVFSQSPEPPYRPDTWRTPGYPLFLAAIMLLGGGTPAALIVVQQLLSVANVLLLFGIARQHMSDRRAAIAAVLFLAEPFHLFYGLWLMATTLFVTLLLLAWHAWQMAIGRRHWAWGAWLGVLCGMMVLVRPVALLVPVVVLGGVLGLHWYRRRSTNPPVVPGAKAILAYVLACVVVLTSWMVRNRVVAGHFALSDQSGVVLAYFKATEVVLWREGRTADRYVETSLDPARATESHRVWDRIDAELAERLPGLTDDQRASLHWWNLAQGNKTTVDSFAISRALSRIARADLMESPLSTIACYMTRCGSILTFPLDLALRPPTGGPAKRVPRGAMASLYVLLCLAVVVSLGRRRGTLVNAYFPLAGTAALLLATTPQIDPRFRVPMIPLLILVALLPRTRRTAGGAAANES